jgi:GrpB-like predicted nucleotidyltransferase (UPF0157 family)
MNAEEKPTDEIVVGYDPKWVLEFEGLAVVLAEALGPLASGIHHIGSTSIPGMIAKPILDVDVELAAGVYVWTATEILTTLGYDYEGELGISDRHAYRRRSSAVPISKHRVSWMSHHLYVCPNRSSELVRHLLFRDALREHVELRNEYERIKQEAVRRACGVKRVYVEEKVRLGDTFFRKVLST